MVNTNDSGNEWKILVRSSYLNRISFSYSIWTAKHFSVPFAAIYDCVCVRAYSLMRCCGVNNIYQFQLLYFRYLIEHKNIFSSFHLFWTLMFGMYVGVVLILFHNCLMCYRNLNFSAIDSTIIKFTDKLNWLYLLFHLERW